MWGNMCQYRVKDVVSILTVYKTLQITYNMRGILDFEGLISAGNILDFS